VTPRLRLDRLLANLGYGSRKQIALLVKAQCIALHGVPLRQADERVALADALSGALTFNGERLDPPSPLTIMLHKPAGYTCSHKEAGDIVYDLLPPRWQARNPSLSSAGRLDKESTGQLIITDDGELLHRITHPKSKAPKHYEVSLEQDLRGDETALFATGNFQMVDDDEPLKPAEWTPDGPRRGRMVLHEGRYHQIRRMFATLGNLVIALHRHQTGQLALGALKAGEYRILSDEDIRLVTAG
jgi:16S rRNA pseudouridine516 synthase